MTRRIFCFCVVAVVLLITATCAHPDTPEATLYTNEYGRHANQAAGSTGNDTYIEALYRLRLFEQGWDEEQLSMWASDNISFQNLYNQGRFIGIADALVSGGPIGPSGEVVAGQYMGPLHFDDRGILNVAVLPGAFDHPASATAIQEMREMGIIVYTVVFTQQEIAATIDRLNNISSRVFEAGASSWGQGAENGVTLWLDPYTSVQKALFTAFLLENNINPDIILFRPAVTQEMRDRRVVRIAEATGQPSDKIVLVGDVDVSRTGIAFFLENRTSEEFSYGAPWDLAYFYGGRWHPVPHLPGAGSGIWTMEGYFLQAGGIQQYRINFEWHFGELAPGRYMFIRDGWQGQWHQDMPGVFALVEFEVTATTPLSLPPSPEQEWLPYVHVVSHSHVTPAGMRVVVENTSDYDMDHRAQLIFIVPAVYATTDDWWEWQDRFLPILPFDGEWEDHFMQGQGFLPAGGTLEFEISWAAIFGELPPGDYIIDLSLMGHAHPPHPTGWGGGSGRIAFTVPSD